MRSFVLIQCLLAMALLGALPQNARGIEIVSPFLPLLEVNYDLGGSELEIEECLGGCTTNRVAVGPGSMTVVFVLDSNQMLRDGALARLKAFDLALSFSTLGQTTDVTMAMLGYADGHFNAGGFNILWDAPAREMRTVGTSTCEAGALCETLGGLPPATTPIDITRDEPIGTLQFSLTEPPRTAMSWGVSSDFAAVTLTLHVKGIETDRSIDFTGRALPEPAVGLLLGAGLLGLAAQRRRS